MTDNEIALARQLFPLKRPRNAHYLKFYSEEQINWLRENYPDNPTSIIAGIMREKVVDLSCFAHRLHISHTREYKQRRFAQHIAKYQRREIIRARYGLPRLGKKRITEKAYTKKQQKARWRGRQKGYIPGDYLLENERWFIYYDEDTRRSHVFERNLPKLHLWALPLQTGSQTPSHTDVNTAYSDN